MLILFCNGAGRRINHDILNCNSAEYGAGIIKTLADRLQIKFARGFGLRVIHRCVQFERLFSEEKIVLSLSQHLKWTHFVSLLNINNQFKREFYAEMCVSKNGAQENYQKKLMKCYLKEQLLQRNLKRYAVALMWHGLQACFKSEVTHLHTYLDCLRKILIRVTKYWLKARRIFPRYSRIIASIPLFP